MSNKIIQFNGANNPLLRAQLAKRKNASSFNCEAQTFTLDDLEDIDINRKGTHTAVYLSRTLDKWIENFGPFCEIKLATPHSNTVIKYNAIVDASGTAISGTYGKHPEFYRGWLKGQSGAKLSACKYNFERQGTRKEARHWVEGFLYGADYLSDDNLQVINPNVHPYQAGAVKAFQDVDSNRVVNLKNKLEEETNYTGSSLKDELMHEGYFDVIKAIHQLWPRGLDI